MEEGKHWEAGRWAHYLLPYEGGLHVYNVYGYDSTDRQAPELNREILLEVMGSVASLGKRPILLGVTGTLSQTTSPSTWCTGP
eukprot:1501841-Amphidinium_carterae.1